MTQQQQALMFFDPATRDKQPYPSHAAQWRKYWGALAWLYNPWSGEQRKAGDVGSDPFGHLIKPQNEPLYADTSAQTVDKA